VGSPSFATQHLSKQWCIAMLDNSQQLRFQLNLSYEQYLTFYQGITKTIMVKADDGRNISFPASNIQRYLTKAGIQGYFEMQLTAQHKFIAIKRLDG
jgi:hypothetical protein